MSSQIFHKKQSDARYRHNKRLLQTAVLICTIVLSGNAFSNGTEYKLKAAYLYQFTKFTQWPDHQFIDDETPIQICILGRNPFGNSLESFSGRTSQQRNLSILYLSSLENISGCHVIFISQSEEKRLTQILHKVENLPVLTVSDIEGFARRGGIIGFVYKRKKVGIEINVDASRAAGAKLSSKLLEVATLVQDGMPEQTP